MPPLHVALGTLGFLLGTWRGEGEGSYPTVERFAYGEEVTFSHVGKPFLSYRQRTWALDDGRALHAEAGYLRPGAPGGVELVVAHPTGVVELSEGTVEGTTIELHSRLVGCTTTAKPVTAVGRHLQVEGDVLRYRLTMAAVGLDEDEHLSATLRRLSATGGSAAREQAP